MSKRSATVLAIFLCAMSAHATQIQFKKLSELMADADHVIIGKVVKVDMVDRDGKQVRDKKGRTGPGLQNQIRLHVEIEKDGILRTTGDGKVTKLTIPLWQRWHYTLGQIKGDMEGKSYIFLLKGKDYQTVYPGLFRREMSDKAKVVELLGNSGVMRQAEDLFEADMKRFRNARIKKISPRQLPKRTTEFCKPYRFYTVNVPVAKDELRSGHPGYINYQMASSPEKAFRIGSDREISSFLTQLKRPVANEADVILTVGAFADLLSAKVVTHMPKKKSIIKKYEAQKPDDWPLVITGTETGWKAGVTLMTDAGIEYCVRYELEVSRKGEVKVVKMKTVYTYTMYE